MTLANLETALYVVAWFVAIAFMVVEVIRIAKDDDPRNGA